MYDIETENRFWSKVETGGEDECWECVAMFSRKGYGQFRVKYEKIRAHRFSYQLFHNRLIQDGMVICHKCDNPACVNPHHLFEASTQENTADRDKKGRTSKGEKQGLSKLTEKQVLEIRAKYKNGGTIQEKLAKEYKIGQTTVYAIINRETWKHI